MGKTKVWYPAQPPKSLAKELFIPSPNSGFINTMFHFYPLVNVYIVCYGKSP
jgi:hypothetical protein